MLEMHKKTCIFFGKFQASVKVISFCRKMEDTTNSLEFQNSEVVRPKKKKSGAGKPRQHRPYKSVSGASLDTRIVDITKKMHLWESKMEVLRDKLKQHNDEVALRETTTSAAV